MMLSNKIQSLISRLVPQRKQPISCAIYARSATSPNRLGIARQIKVCRAYARKQGWKVVDGFVLVDEGSSGTSSGEREALQAMLALAKVSPRPFDCVVCEDSARLARNWSIAAGTLDLFILCRVKVYSAKGLCALN